MEFSHGLGPALDARLQLCRPDERLFWAASYGLFYYDFPGLDLFGQPLENPLTKGVRAVGRGVGDFLVTGLDVLLFDGGSDERYQKQAPPPPDHLVFGPGLECLAHQTVSQIGLEPGNVASTLWMLTSARLAVFRVKPAPEPEPEPEPENRSLLNMAIGFGKGMAKFGKEVVEIIADNREKYGGNIEGEAVRMTAYVPVHEFPREQIASIGVISRQLENGDEFCLRVSLVDGSGVDLRLFSNDPAVAARVTELTNGM